MSRLTDAEQKQREAALAASVLADHYARIRAELAAVQSEIDAGAGMTDATIFSRARDLDDLFAWVARKRSEAEGLARVFASDAYALRNEVIRVRQKVEKIEKQIERETAKPNPETGVVQYSLREQLAGAKEQLQRMTA